MHSSSPPNGGALSPPTLAEGHYIGLDLVLFIIKGEVLNFRYSSEPLFPTRIRFFNHFYWNTTSKDVTDGPISTEPIDARSVQSSCLIVTH